MRNLNIRREKSFVGCLAKMKVYIEDAAAPEITVDNVPYRKIGTLKNGEVKTFTIDDNERNIILIADKLSKGFCNEIYRLPAGESDIFLSGRNIFNPATGNAFRFNGVTDQNILQNRKKGFKKGMIILIVSIMLGAAAGIYFPLSAIKHNLTQPKEFSKDGMTITLNQQFSETPMDGYNVCYDSTFAAVFVLKEEFSLAEGFQDYTLDDYGNLVISANDFGPSVTLQKSDGLTYFEYDNTNTDNEPFSYFAVVYKSSDAFWLVQFAAPEQSYDKNKQTIINWAKTVKFTDQL